MLFLSKIFLRASIPAHHSLPNSSVYSLRLEHLLKLCFYRGQLIPLCRTHYPAQLAPPEHPEGHLQDVAAGRETPSVNKCRGRLQPGAHQDITMQASMLLFSIQSLKESCLTELNSCCVFRDVNVLHYLMNCVILI